jgi:DNA sulfur modification protein DndB
MVKPARLKAIGRYVDGGGKFPTNIVINFKLDGPLQFEQKENFGDSATGILSLPGQYGAAWVIDGSTASTVMRMRTDPRNMTDPS